MKDDGGATRFYVIRFLSQLTVLELTDSELVAKDLGRYQVGLPQETRGQAEALKASYAATAEQRKSN